MNAATTIELSVEPDVHRAVWAQFVAPVLDGRTPCVEQIELPAVADPGMLFPLGSVTSDVKRPGSRQTMALTNEWGALAVTLRSGELAVWVRAADAELLAKAVAAIRANAPVVEPDDSTVEVDFWQVSDGAYTRSRSIEVPAWSSIEANYPDDVWGRLDVLAEHEPTLDDGRIILWHGPPGTGKTTAIRGLARAWRGRARFQVVLDPDAVLSRAAILMELLLAESWSGCDWRVLVIEDADELIRADAKQRVGQSLSRLLNVGDGIVGQGIKVLVLITTNEPIDRIHPALGRPGRCLAQIEFRRFTRAEAAQLVDGPLPPGADFSLAELKAAPTIESTVADGPAAGYL